MILEDVSLLGDVQAGPSFQSPTVSIDVLSPTTPNAPRCEQPREIRRNLTVGAHRCRFSTSREIDDAHADDRDSDF